MNLIAVDFGKNHCGVAKFQNKKLLYATTIKAPTQRLLVERLLELNGPGKWRWVGELPRVRQKQRHTKKGVEDVLKTIDMFRARQSIKMLPVTSWKAAIPKAVHQSRFEQVLSKEEKKRIENDHNAWDAVGIGLFALGRTTRQGLAA